MSGAETGTAGEGPSRQETTSRDVRLRRPRALRFTHLDTSHLTYVLYYRITYI